MSLACSSWRQAAEALRFVQEFKRAKNVETCFAHGLNFATFSFSVLESFCPACEEILTQVCQPYVSHMLIRPWEAHKWVYHRFSFDVMSGVAEEFVRHESLDFGW